jgi:thiol-disulfide isomerase/thioredoxin
MPEKSKIAKSGGFWLPKCPYCRAVLPLLIIARSFLDGNGQRVRVGTVPGMKRAVFEECDKCGGRWPIFARDEGSSSPDTVAVVETYRTDLSGYVLASPLICEPPNG